MDEVFKAINDPSRRLLLDELFEHDGQTLGELCSHLPDMTRYGVMNHLKVLEAAGIVTTLKQGRSKLHYLNPVPIRLIHDRWISKYAEARVGAITDIKARVEGGGQRVGAPDHIYKAYINGSQADVWDAIVNPAKTVQYFYGTVIDVDLEVGGKMNYDYPDGRQASVGQVIAIDPPNKLEFMFHAKWDEALDAEGPVREVWALAEVNGMTELAIEIYDMPAGSKTYEDFTSGIPYIISGLKSLVETGKGLPAPY